MCIIRVSKKANGKFAQVDNRYLQSPLLSLKAKGLLTYLLSKPDNWNIRLSELQKNNADGRDAIRSTFKELEKYGYMKRVVTRDKLGKFHTDYTVYEVSQLETKKAVETAHTIPKIAEKVVAEDIKPQESTKNGEYDDMLELIPQKDRQAVLDTLLQACKTRDVKNTRAYLSGLIKRYQAGTFVPVTMETPKNREEHVNPVADEKKKECKICNDHGEIQAYVVPKEEYVLIPSMFSHKCNHDLEFFDNFIRRQSGKIIEIFSATDDKYRKPDGHLDASAEMNSRRKKHDDKLEESGVVGKNNGSGGVFKRIGDLLR